MHTIKNEKPRSIYKTFPRKGQGDDVSHYCPGCGHGIVHNLIAEAIDDLGIQDRTIFCAPVGCSVFAYYYFDTGNIQCSHGRAPAVATAVRRTHRNAIIISYQGDGDLAGIGMSHIIHAANRGENITVFFINNAIYGMTGGQMAPTTLLQQKTLTTPGGRDAVNDGYPIRMAEIVSTLTAPVLVERVSQGDGKRVIKARKVIRQALKNQVDGNGFSFVEILSPCPINWKTTPVEARKWLIEVLEKEYPVQNFRERSVEVAVHPTPRADVPLADVLRLLQGDDVELSVTPRAHGSVPDQHVKIAGFGGQGVLSAGLVLATCAVREGLNTTWLPSYGPEMRGGTANASVNISTDTIGSPVVSYPNVLFALNLPSLDAFEPLVQPNGLVVVNTSLIKRPVARKDVRVVELPASDMAKEVGVPATLNIILLAVYAKMTGVISVHTLRAVLPETLKRKALPDANLKALDRGEAYFDRELKPRLNL